MGFSELRRGTPGAWAACPARPAAGPEDPLPGSSLSGQCISVPESPENTCPRESHEPRPAEDSVGQHETLKTEVFLKEALVYHRLYGSLFWDRKYKTTSGREVMCPEADCGTSHRPAFPSPLGAQTPPPPLQLGSRLLLGGCRLHAQSRPVWHREERAQALKSPDSHHSMTSGPGGIQMSKFLEKMQKAILPFNLFYLVV